MTDLADLFKRKHKIQGNNFGKILQPEAVDLRVKQLNVHRRKQRNSLLDGKRQMPNSPFVEDSNFTKKLKKEERTEKLKLWKRKRDNDRAEQRRKQKLVFKVCRAPDVIPIVESKLMKKDSKMVTFAPANYLFNPPKNIKPQQFINGPVTRSRSANDVAAAASKVTRSTRKRGQKPLLEHSKPKALCKTNLSKELTASEKLYNLRKTQIVTRSVKKQSLQNSSTSPSTGLKPDQEMVIAENCCATPESVYMSPFITVSRGKDNQRKEYHYRKNSTVGVDTPSPKSLEKLKNAMSSITPQAAARYFNKVLDNAIDDIEKLCNQWSLYRKDIIAEEPCNMIDVAIGQSQLLRNNKFKQFRTLIKQCEFQTEKISCEDLHGFWDLLFIQVDNLQKRFENLTALRNNDWREVLPKPQAAKRPKQTMNLQTTSTTAPRQNVKTITPQKVRVQTPYGGILKNQSSQSSHLKSVPFDEESNPKGVRRSTRRIRKKLF